jgi:hypothetical protein
MHNAIFQYVIDAGYIGALLFISILYITVRNAARAQTAVSLAVVGSGLFFIMMGLTEAVPTIYFRDVFFVFVMLSGYAATLNQSVFLTEKARPNLA